MKFEFAREPKMNYCKQRAWQRIAGHKQSHLEKKACFSNYDVPQVDRLPRFLVVGHLFKNKNTRFTDISGIKLRI